MIVLRAVQRAEVWAEKKVQSMAVQMGTLKVAQTVLSRAEQRVVPWVALMENERDSQLAAMLAVYKAPSSVLSLVAMLVASMVDLKEPLMAVLMVDHWVGDLAD